MNSSSRRRTTNIDAEIGFRIRQARQRKRLSQKELAEEVGVSFQQFQKYEQGINKIPPARLYQVSRILEVEPNDLFGVQENTNHLFEAYGDVFSLDRRAYDMWHKIDNAHSKRIVLELMKMLQTKGTT